MNLFWPYVHFLNAHRIGIANISVFNDLVCAIMLNDQQSLSRIIGLFPELREFADHISVHRGEDWSGLLTDDLLASSAYLFSDHAREMALLEMTLRESNLDAEAFLEVGCGWAHRPVFLKSQQIVDGRIVCLDLLGRCIKKAKAIATKEKVELEFVQGSGVELPFPSGCFGQVWATDSIPFMVQWKKAIIEMIRVLSNSGRILISLTTIPMGGYAFPPQELVDFLRSHNLRVKIIGRQFIFGEKQ